MLLLMHAYSVFNEENPTDVTINFFAWQNKRMGTDSNCLSQATKPAVSDLESSMLTIIQTFHQYSGQKCNLKKADLKELINNEMNNFIVKIKENDTLDKLFADLDQNGDLEIDFKEFIALIAMVTSACNELFVPKQQKN
ncbi:protein S100-B isoform X1 [Oreochromis niloticus]|uniref:protein S100-B isoform X1 n=1 Tax=Oreochromis niloticus TaxID=8128 RepID=UPI000905BB04|nr:protein S100-B isoform X1 [Oreochromis niloticus]XP_039467745.1 protein S100-B-like isoform X1 [Oreochromis aureus]